ncbi:MAG: NUDIX domain-containing protein [Cyanobacteria bacterium J06633_2]
MTESARLRVSIVALFVDRDDVLLLHQMTPPEPNCWDLPGGGLEAHEAIADGLRREVQEETGVTQFTIDRLLMVTELFLERPDQSTLHTINIIYRCTVLDRSQPLFSSDPEVGPKGIQWISIASLREEDCSRRCWTALKSAGLVNATDSSEALA